MEFADCIVIQGSNMAECHPIAFRWAMKAKLKGATIIHVDPRFTRTSAKADIHAPIRSGSDIAFLGGIINYVLDDRRWNSDSFFRQYLLNNTNAASIINEEFRDTEDLDGIFSGFMRHTDKADPWAYNGSTSSYDNASWQYARDGKNPKPHRSSEGSALEDLIRSLKMPAVLRDEKLQHPHAVMQLVRRHFSRYTPEMVEKVTGCPKETFLKVARAVLENSGRDRTTCWAYAVGWAQHTNGSQIIGCCALLQLLLGNIGRPGGGILALRGHASIQGSSDVPTLYHSIHGYMPAPSALKDHGSLRAYLAAEASAEGYWANMPRFLVSYLKSMYGPAATPENDFGYGWHPKISGDHSHMPMFVAMTQGDVKGMLCIGQNPATSINAGLERQGLRNLQWLVVKDNFITETASFWNKAPEIVRKEIKPEEIQTEVFFFPSAQIAESEGSFTNTQRMLQWHFKAADPPGDCRSDAWFTYQLGLRLKKLYARSSRSRDRGIRNLVWDYAPAVPADIPGEPDVERVLKEINGFQTDHPDRHLNGFDELKNDGSTTCASWIYCGVFPSPDRNLAKRREPDPPGITGAHLNWGWAWPANRRVLYNRASADPDGRPWSERKKWVWWDGRKWTGYDTPDFAIHKRPDAPADPEGIGLDCHSGRRPFIMMPDGVGLLFTPNGLTDGPLPTHYEPVESPVENLLYHQQNNPVLKYWKHEANRLAEVADERFPYVMTTFRLTEHFLSGAMSRWNPWLSELMPELFIEVSPELAGELEIYDNQPVRITTLRGSIQARALITGRMRPFLIGGKRIHHVGMPWHWGWQGVVVGDAVNQLTALIGDPNVSIHESKAFVCNVEKAQ
ncbi:MAG: molybdopterin-dependent oxidoreductase [Desulfobacteraceae bacterium]